MGRRSRQPAVKWSVIKMIMIMIMMMMMIPQVSEKNETDWAMFGYEGQSNVIKVVSTGQRFVFRHHSV